MNLPAPVRSMLLLGAIGLGAVVLLATLHELTRERIAEQADRAARTALQEVLPEVDYDNDPADDTRVFKHPDAGAVTVHRAFRDGQLVGAVLALTTREGYSGPIRLLVGMQPDGRVVAVRVVEHRETPGLGDGIELRRSDWIRQFAGTRRDDPAADAWRPDRRGGDFDTLTGATITSSAVIRAVHAALVLYDEHRDTIGTPPP